MAKKQTTEVAEIKSPDPVISEAALSGALQNGDIADLAAQLGMDMELPADVLVARAAEAINVTERMTIGAGLCLLKAKSLCLHGEFEQHLKAVQIPAERARELMTIAAVVEAANPADRKRLMHQPKVALIGLARMDGEIRQKLLDTGALDERLTLHEYHVLIGKKDRQIEAQEERLKRLTAQVRTAEVTGRKALDAATPLTVAQLRREAASYAQDALACMQGFTGIAQRLAPLDGEAQTRPWVTPVAVSLVSLLLAVRESAEYQLQQIIEAFGLDVEVPTGPALSMATPGPEEAELIHEAMTGVLIDCRRRLDQLQHGQYVEARDRTPSKGAYRKAPGAKS